MTSWWVEIYIGKFAELPGYRWIMCSSVLATREQAEIVLDRLLKLNVGNNSYRIACGPMP